MQDAFSNYEGLSACSIHVSRGDGGDGVFRCRGPAVGDRGSWPCLVRTCCGGTNLKGTVQTLES